MILETFSIEEISSEVKRDYSIVFSKIINQIGPYKKDFLKRRKEIVYTKYIHISYNRNNYIAVVNSYSGSIKDFGVQIYLVLNTNKGSKIYFRINENGSIFKFSKHFIERFIERSPYNCNKDNFLSYLVKETMTPLVYKPYLEVSYAQSRNGLMVLKGNTFITYMTNLSHINTFRREFATKESALFYNRNKSIKALIEFLNN